MKKRWIMGVAGVLALGASLLFTACGAPTQKGGENGAAYHKITAEQAKQRMDENPQAIVVDVRTQPEYEEKHIPGAVLVPNETIGGGRPEQLPDLNAEILVHCRTGVRSKQAAEKLVALGYTKVYDFGGINSWPYETVSGK